MPRIIDTFTFFNELDLLEVRLETLNPVVDLFVIGEATVTYRGEPKPLHFLENQARFRRFLPKIRHVKIEDMPLESGFEENWDRETHQRRALQRGIPDAQSNDIVMMSDLDEIPRPEKVLEAARGPRGLRLFRMRFFSYFANCETHPDHWWWIGTGMAEYRLAKGRFEHALRKIPTRLRSKPYASPRKRLSLFIQRMFLSCTIAAPIRLVDMGGHHFSWLGGAEAVLKKRGAISMHRGERFDDNYYTITGAGNAVEKALRGARELDSTMPAILSDNRFAHLLAPVGPSTR